MHTVTKAAMFTAGGIAGAVLGVLYAPRKGSLTRARIKTKAREQKEIAEEKALEAKERLKEKGKEGLGNVRQRFSQRSES